MSDRISIVLDEDTYEKWSKKAEEMGMSNSEWGRSMIRAGLKKFGRAVEPDKSRDDLRQQLNDLRRELRRARERVRTLEKQLHTSERQAVIDYLDENPGATFQEVLQHVTNTASARVPKILDQVEGDEIDIDEEGRMYTRK